MMATLNLIGFASGIAANNPDCALGPWYLYYHPELLQKLSMQTSWKSFIQTTSLMRGKDVLSLAEKNLQQLSEAVLPLAQTKQKFCVIGGDHSCGIGTWSAVAHAYRQAGEMGLIWVDAHMDSHTPETSLSQNIHGMPLAVLLGQGASSLCQIADDQPKVKPEHVCLVGIRSYESGEQALLERLGVKIYYMDEVKDRGIDIILQEAQHYVSKNTCGFGLTIDLDAINPEDAPGVGCREEDGIDGKLLQEALRKLDLNTILGLEITEYNPVRDEEGKTAKLIIDLMEAVFEGAMS